MNPTMNDQGNLNTLREMLTLIKERDELQSKISDLSEKFRLLTVERNDLKTRNAELVTRNAELSVVSPTELESLIQKRNNRQHYCPSCTDDYTRAICIVEVQP